MVTKPTAPKYCLWGKGNRLELGQSQVVLATGASGMIGTNLIQRLTSEGFQVWLFLRRGGNPRQLGWVEDKVNILYGDVTDKEAVQQAVERAMPRFVFHLASTSFNPPNTPSEAHLRVNSLGTLYLLEALLKVPDSKMIFTGSAAAYGSGSLLKEDQVLNPGTMLGASKACASILIQTFARLHQLNTVELRLTTPFGPWESPRRLIPHTILSALAGEDVSLSSGMQQRDFVYVDDVVDAVIRAATRSVPNGSIFNIGSGVGTTVKDVAGLALQLMGNPVQLRLGELPTRDDEIMEMSADITKARDYLGWKPQISLKDGLGKSIDWFTQNREMALSLP